MTQQEQQEEEEEEEQEEEEEEGENVLSITYGFAVGKNQAAILQLAIRRKS